MWSLFGWYNWIYELEAEYQEGFTVKVLYHPKKPSLSCLKRGNWGSIVGLYLAVIFFGYIAASSYLKIWFFA